MLASHRAGLDRSATLPKALPLCFQCYRAELEREKALKAAGQLETASEARFRMHAAVRSCEQVPASSAEGGPRERTSGLAQRDWPVCRATASGTNQSAPHVADG